MKLPLSSLLAALVAAGCSKESEVPVAATPQEATAAVESAFATAPQETRKAAAGMAHDIASDPAGALGGLEEIGKRADLTPEQRDAAAKAMAAAIAELQKAAAGGSEAASQALEARAARK